LTRCWGFFTRQGRIPPEEELESARSRVGMEHVILDEENRTLFFEKEGIELSPASLGKGFALDYAMKVARERGLKDVLLNGGYSSVLASGAPAWKEAWQIDVQNPVEGKPPFAHLQLRNQGFSSSGSALQFFVQDGKKYGHIIDPRTGRPTETMLNVNVVAATAAEAEAWSTAFYVMGVEKTLKYCENRKDIGVLLLGLPDEQGNAEVITSNLAEDQVEVLNVSC